MGFQASDNWILPWMLGADWVLHRVTDSKVNTLKSRAGRWVVEIIFKVLNYDSFDFDDLSDAPDF
jgi:hypothetical protein